MHMGENAGVLLSGGYRLRRDRCADEPPRERVATFSAGFADDKQSELPARGAARQALRHRAPRDRASEARRARPARRAWWSQRDAPFSRPADVALHLARARSVAPCEGRAHRRRRRRDRSAATAATPCSGCARACAPHGKTVKLRSTACFVIAECTDARRNGAGAIGASAAPDPLLRADGWLPTTCSSAATA